MSFRTALMNNPCTRRGLAAVIAGALLFTASPAGAGEPRNPKAAAFLSIVLPGLGEAYAGGHRSSRFFFFTEAGFWSGLLLFRHLESSRGDNFRAYAAAHAGLDPAGKSNAYFDEVGLFESLRARNEYEQFIEGEFAELRQSSPETDWEWDSEASRLTFRSLRKKETSARQKGLLFVGGLIFNRFASSLNAAHIARKTQTRPTLGVQVVPTQNGTYAVAHVRF